MEREYAYVKDDDGTMAEVTSLGGDVPNFDCVISRNGRKITQYRFYGWVSNVKSLAQYALRTYKEERK